MGCFPVTIERILEQRFDRHYLTEDRRGDAVWFGHCEAHWMPLVLQRAENNPLILTMRHPLQVFSSWVKRGREADHDFREMWTNLFRLKERFADSFWLPVDTEDREGRLQAISERLEHQFTTDWRPVCATQNSYQWKGGMTLDEVRGFVATLPFGPFGS